MLEIVPRADHPPRVLGTIAQNQRWAMTKDFDEQDDEEADPARLAIKSAEAARKVCEAIKELCVADVESPLFAERWAMLFKSAAERHTAESTRTPNKHLPGRNGSTGGHQPERGRTQQCLSTKTTPRCSLRAPSSVTADAAFLSSWICTRKAVQEHAEAMGRPLQHELDREEAQRARANLQHAGVKVDDDGKIELSDEANHTTKQAPWIMKDDEETDNVAEQAHGPAQRTLEHTLTLREQSPSSSQERVQTCTEATLDAAIRWPTSFHTTVVDVTVRCPHASRYGGGVTASPTEAAEDKKHKRYGPRVSPLSRLVADLDVKDETRWKHWQRKHAAERVQMAQKRWPFFLSPAEASLVTRSKSGVRCTFPMHFFHGPPFRREKGHSVVFDPDFSFIKNVRGGRRYQMELEVLDSECTRRELA